MAHFAKLDNNNKVIKVIVVHNNELLDENGEESEQKGIDFLKQLFKDSDAVWKQTSYNRNFRTRLAGPGQTYDESRDAFILPKPYDSWTLDENTLDWTSPIAHPTDGLHYNWDEELQQWL